MIITAIATTPNTTRTSGGKFGRSGWAMRNIHHQSTTSWQRQKQRWFEELQTGCEGRSIFAQYAIKQGLRRSRHRGPDGIRRWIGLGVMADNVIHIGAHLAGQTCSK